MGWFGPMTHRQFNGWLLWLRLEWNNPSRADYHVMRAAQRVQQTWSKNPGSIELKDQAVKFTMGDEKQAVDEDEGADGPPGPITEEQIAKVLADEAKMRSRRRRVKK